MKLPADTYIQHATTGRLRLKIPSQKRNLSFFRKLQREWEGYTGIDRIRINPLSASVVLHYQKLPREIMAGMPSKYAFAAGDRRKKETVFQQVQALFHRADRRLQHFTDGELDLPTLTFMALLLVGFYQISKRNFTAPAWYTAFWYALNIFLKAKE